MRRIRLGRGSRRSRRLPAAIGGAGDDCRARRLHRRTQRSEFRGADSWSGGWAESAEPARRFGAPGIRAQREGDAARFAVAEREGLRGRCDPGEILQVRPGAPRDGLRRVGEMAGRRQAADMSAVDATLEPDAEPPAWRRRRFRLHCRCNASGAFDEDVRFLLLALGHHPGRSRNGRRHRQPVALSAYRGPERRRRVPHSVAAVPVRLVHSAADRRVRARPGRAPGADRRVREADRGGGPRGWAASSR